jgi:hypothetical protein
MGTESKREVVGGNREQERVCTWEQRTRGRLYVGTESKREVVRGNKEQDGGCTWEQRARWRLYVGTDILLIPWMRRKRLKRH